MSILCLTVNNPEIRAANGRTVILTDFFYYESWWDFFVVVVSCLFDC